MRQPVLHQAIVGATPGDAIADHAFLLRGWLREMGFRSEIFAEGIHPALQHEVHPIESYRPEPGEKWFIYHHSIGCRVATQLLAHASLQFILIYHNITPPEFFADSDPGLARQLVWGMEQLRALAPRTGLAVSVSAYNQRDLHAIGGFARSEVLPIVLDEARYNLPSDPKMAARLAAGGDGPLLLFIGRMAPNKKVEDLLKLLYFYRRINPTARLALVGSGWLPAYEQWLRDLAQDLGLGHATLFLGHVSQQEMVTCYRQADLYVSMSAHEGFGKPLIESMYFDLPVLAYAEAGVPGTLGGAGVLFHRKDYEALAEVVEILLHDAHLRQRIIAGQRERVRLFLAAEVRRKWENLLAELE
jgi:glycosyltransferase involved in cell wall biosynthesis